VPAGAASTISWLCECRIWSRTDVQQTPVIVLMVGRCRTGFGQNATSTVTKLNVRWYYSKQTFIFACYNQLVLLRIVLLTPYKQEHLSLRLIDLEK